MRKTLNELQKLFLIRQCQDNYFSNRTRPCLQYQIRRCTAPCVGYIDEASYAEDINAAILFLEGKNRSVIDALVERMDRASNAKEYERAARFRDQIARFKKVEAEQIISRASTKDLDVFAVASKNAVHCVTVHVSFVMGKYSAVAITFHGFLSRQTRPANPERIPAAVLPR